MMQQMMGAMGGGGALGGFGAPPAAPADTRAPEERFQTQLQVCGSISIQVLHKCTITDAPVLQQLQDMGFTNASQNVRALLATAGNVHAAIEYILNGGGL